LAEPQPIVVRLLCGGRGRSSGAGNQTKRTERRLRP